MKNIIKKLIASLLVLSFIFLLSSNVSATSTIAKINQRDSIYFLMTDRFYDGDKTNNMNVIRDDLTQYQGGDFQGVIDKLDYIKDLGFTAIWISPVVKNDIGGYHGYWADDFYKTNEHFGSLEKLKELVKKAHEKGIKVIVDLVVNHTGPGFSKVNDSKYANWFHPRIDISDYNDQKQVENGWLAGLPDLNQENPEVSKYLIDMSKWWIKETGIDGYRLDTFRHVPKDFWITFSKEIKKVYPGFYLIGEVFSGDPSYVGGYQDSGADGFLDFPTYYAANDVFKGDKPASYLGEMINNEGSIYKNRNLMGTFIDNHDVPRFVAQIYNLKDEKLKSALTFMMTYTGIPVMYYGTEIGMDGGTDPDNRRNMDFNVKSPITDYVKKLTSIRNSNKALTMGNIEVLKSDDNILCYSRTFENNTVIVAFNTSDIAQKFEFSVPEKYINKYKLATDLISTKDIRVKNGNVEIDMAPMQARVFVFENSNPKLNKYAIYIVLAVVVMFLISGAWILRKYKLRSNSNS